MPQMKVFVGSLYLKWKNPGGDLHPGLGRVPRHIDANSGDGDVNNGTGGHDEISTLMVTMGMILIL